MHRRKLIGLAAALPLLSLGGCILPSESSLVRRFRRHRNKFETLLQMARAETQVINVYPNHVRLKDDYGPTDEVRRRYMSDERLARYNTLLSELHLNIGVAIYSDMVEFLAESVGLLSTGEIKGYLWTPKRPGVLVDHIDRYGPRPTFDESDSVSIYQPIATNWYVTRSWSI